MIRYVVLCTVPEKSCPNLLPLDALAKPAMLANLYRRQSHDRSRSPSSSRRGREEVGKRSGIGREEVGKRLGRGREEVGKRSGRGREEVGKRSGRGREEVGNRSARGREEVRDKY